MEDPRLLHGTQDSRLKTLRRMERLLFPLYLYGMTDLCSSRYIHRLLILRCVSCSDFDILSVCAVWSPGASYDPLALNHA